MRLGRVWALLVPLQGWEGERIVVWEGRLGCLPLCPLGKMVDALSFEYSVLCLDGIVVALTEGVVVALRGGLTSA